MPAVRTESARKRLTLARVHHRLGDRAARRHRRERRAAEHPARARRRAGRAAVGRQRLPADARLADPDRRIARGPVRRAAGVRARGRGLRRRPRWRARSRPSIGALVAARALQGVAGALLVPSSLAVIVNTFEESERGAAIGSWTAWGGIAGVLGPLAGGELLAIASWRWIFLINLPFAIVCVALILLAIPRAERPVAAVVTGNGVAVPGEGGGGRGGQPRPDRPRRIDLPGAALCALGLGGSGVRADRAAAAGMVELGVLVPLIAGRRAAARRSWPTSLARATRCCRWGCSGGATSRPATSRRSRCMPACRSCSSSWSCSCSRSAATRRCRAAWRRCR